METSIRFHVHLINLLHCLFRFVSEDNASLKNRMCVRRLKFSHKRILFGNCRSPLKPVSLMFKVIVSCFWYFNSKLKKAQNGEGAHFNKLWSAFLEASRLESFKCGSFQEFTLY